MSNNDEFTTCMKACFDTTDGKKALAFLKESYVEATAMGSDSHQTYYRLGQKELIQLLIQTLENPEDLSKYTSNGGI